MMAPPFCRHLGHRSRGLCFRCFIFLLKTKETHRQLIKKERIQWFSFKGCLVVNCTWDDPNWTYIWNGLVDEIIHRFDWMMFYEHIIKLWQWLLQMKNFFCSCKIFSNLEKTCKSSDYYCTRKIAFLHCFFVSKPVRKLKLQHPTAKMMAELSKAQAWARKNPQTRGTNYESTHFLKIKMI